MLGIRSARPGFLSISHIYHNISSVLLRDHDVMQISIVITWADLKKKFFYTVSVPGIWIFISKLIMFYASFQYKGKTFTKKLPDASVDFSGHCVCNLEYFHESVCWMVGYNRLIHTSRTCLWLFPMLHDLSNVTLCIKELRLWRYLANFVLRSFAQWCWNYKWVVLHSYCFFFLFFFCSLSPYIGYILESDLV